MKIKCMLYEKKWSRKPAGKKEVGSVQNRLSETEIDIIELADGLSSGMSFRPGVLVGGRSKINWVE